MRKILVILLVLITYSKNTFGQELERPFILVKSSERNQVLEKIEGLSWAREIYLNLKYKTDLQIKQYDQNPMAYIKQLPFNWSEAGPNAFPPFDETVHIENGVQKNLDNATDEEWRPAELLIKYLQIALDCGMMYYVTQDKKYAHVASSILYAFVKSVQKSELSEWHGRGGWLFPYDGFREVRVIGYRVPLIYDFIAPYLKNGGLCFDIVKKGNTNFPISELQEVCRTYADITINYGHTGSNHSVLEAPNLVYNALAMDDKEEREQLLSYFLTKNTPHQDALNVMAGNYKNKGDIWPETSQYLNHSTVLLTRLMFVVNRYNPSLKLSQQYPNILYALPRLDYFVYPNSEIVRWGDGKRKGTAPYAAIDVAYALADMDGTSEIKEKMGPILNRVLREGTYKRTDMEAVFWFEDGIQGEPETFLLPRTDRVYHAGIVLQRNLSSTGKAEDGLMCFVGGAHMVHGHAEGMNIELYGEGQVLGVDHGRGSYAKDIHENYSRIFAAHNTVIVNGSSQGEDGWANLGINTVELIDMEPKAGEPSISPYHSFSQTRFKDDRGERAEAIQERTLALIRTSPTTGYYIDVFRSKSKLPDEYHDYLYHNIGDAIDFENRDLAFKNTPDKYMANANAKWRQNKAYRNPGWHFFKKVKTSGIYDKSVKAIFKTEKLSSGNVFMKLHIPGFENREYTKVEAPKTFEAPTPYDSLPTPTLVIRNKGEAWTRPFVVVFEPYNEDEDASIDSVSKLEQNGIYKGLKIVSRTNNTSLIQYVITQSKNEIFQNDALGIYFKGTFAIVTLSKTEDLKSIYIGAGETLRYKDELIYLKDQNSFYKTY